MNLKDLAKKTENSLRSNSPAILTSGGVAGVITTAYLAGKASWDAAIVVNNSEMHTGTAGDKKQRIKERSKLVWKLYIPTVASGACTIGCIVMGARVNSKRAAAAFSLLTVSEKAFSEYREKVVEELGKKKEQKLQDEIVQNKVTNNPPPATVAIGNGTVLCQEAHTGRYFNCDMETLKRAENQINHDLIRYDAVYLNDFYHLLGLGPTSLSSEYGWEVGKLLELRITAAVCPDGRPCLVFDYNYLKMLA